MRIIGLAAFLVAPTAAQAFCGTYVGQPGANLYSGSSQVVLAREGRQTTLTLTNDYRGDLTEFALVLPVPEGLSEEDVQVLDRALIDRVANYSAPRLVEYSCEELYFEQRDYSSGSGCGGFGCSETGVGVRQDPINPLSDTNSDSLDVTVEQEFVAGEYEIVVLASETEADLLKWLQDEGYGVSDEAVDLLGEYIDGGARFLAAKVSLDQAPGDSAAFLSPLQIRYESDSFTLPIRLGTLNSAGSQDLVVYTLTPADRGSVGVSNYPQVEVEEGCLTSAALDDFGGFYQGQLDSAFYGMDAAWTREYAWSPSGCDPCPPGGALEPADVLALGFQDAGDALFSRLHLRYEAEAATQDVAFFTDDSGWAAPSQLRYIVHKDELQGTFPVCGVGYIEDPPLCEHQDQPVQAGVSGWAIGGGFGLFMLGFGVMLRRRSRDEDR